MSHTLPVSLDVALPIGSFEAYLRAIQSAPVLSLEEECDLAQRLHQHNDLQAARQLILSNLRYVVRLAYQYKGYGLALADLVQEGTIGLMKAVKRYDPTQGVRLISFAVQWIKAEMHDFIIRHWRIVKVATTKAQRKLFFNLRKSREGVSYLSPAEARETAKALNVSPDTLQEMDMRLNARDMSLDMTPDDENPSTYVSQYYLEDGRYNPAVLLEHQDSDENRQEALQVALEALDERSRHIIQRRWLDENKATLHDLAAQYAVSAERIRQIENQAMTKLKSAMA